MTMRYDTADLRKPVRTPEGFLRVDAVLTRTGVFAYRQADGSVRRELRLPEEVFKADSLATFTMLPVTDNHPPVPLTAENAKAYQRGSIGDVRQDGRLVLGTMMVTDAALITKMEAGQRAVSCGYHADLEWKPGEYQGEKYDCIQRNIRGNHVAILARGRAGPEARVRLDSEDAIMVTETDERETHMVKYRIDGVEYEVSESASQALDKLIKAMTDAQTSAQSAADKATARADAAEGKVKDLTAAASPEEIHKRVLARVGLERRAAVVLTDVKMDSFSDDALIREVVKKAVPELKQDGLSIDYLRARFDIACDDAEKAAKAKAALNAAARPAPAERKDGAEPVNSEEARKKMVTELRDAWKKPLATTRA